MLIGKSNEIKEKSEMFILNVLALSRLPNSEKLTRFKIATDTLMTFAGEFFTKEIERRNRYNVLQIEFSFIIHRMWQR